MTINDILFLRSDLKQVKIGHISSDGMKEYIKLSIQLNKYNKEFEEKRKDLIEETLAAKNYSIDNLTPEQDKEVSDIVIPILNDYILNTDIDIVTNVLSWSDLYDGILNNEENSSLSLEVKTRLTERLCSEEI